MRPSRPGRSRVDLRCFGRAESRVLRVITTRDNDAAVSRPFRKADQAIVTAIARLARAN
jgi:hypothetical protein